jgi:ankyrin repeat protein
MLKQLVETKQFDLEKGNRDGETAVSLAIKARGFHRTLGVLLDAGAKIPRRKALERYALEHGFPITAKIIASYGDGSFDVDTTMTLEYIDFTYERAMNCANCANCTDETKAMNCTNETKKIDAQQFLEAYLHHRDAKMVEAMILRHDAYPTIHMFLDYCIPKKADDPKTNEYLALAKIVLNYAPELINAKNEALESPLFTAANRGSLPHVKFFISKGATIDDPNELGNTPLWIAAYKRYPCIIDELLDEGAEINYRNLKGNGPIYGVCERGLVKVAEQLMARGVDLMKPNNNGDTYILLCCRNGQWEVLKFLLNYVDEEFVDFKAHIDGFNAIMASAEQNRAECIRVLFEYGVNIDQVTADDNAILARATPLHIASYYNRGDAVRMLLKLGADPNKADLNGFTPLHIAVIQGHVDIVKSLRRGGADMTTKDSSGNSAQSYCRNRPELRKVLIDPALDILMKLAKGGFANTKEAVKILKKHSGVDGLTRSHTAVDIVGDDGTTPFQQAVIHSNFDVVQCMCEIGANKHNTEFWAAFVGNPRIRKLIGYKLDIVVQKNALLFLGKSVYMPEVPSSIGFRMSDRINVVMYGEHKEQYPEYRKMIEGPPNHRFMREKIEIPPKALWDARVFVAKFMYDNPDSRMSVEQLLELALYTNNTNIADTINSSLLAGNVVDHAKYLMNALEIVEPFIGEVYMADPKVDRKLFEIGHEFSWPTFRSASSLWRVATENTEYFAAKARKGTVFAIRSKTGKHIGKYSMYGFDAEVLFTPFTRFRVKNWYRGDVIALGQANIREHTFSLEPEDVDRMRENNRSLIIELEEL